MDVDISVTDTVPADFDEVADKLSAFTASKGAPEWKPVKKTFTACADGREIGKAVTETIWGELHIALLHVEPEERGHGVGMQITRAIEDFARAAGCTFITVNTPDWQGRGFYERCGYETMGRAPLDAFIDGKQQCKNFYCKILIPENSAPS
jgi:GNAT superfamily N-acetyltransferase